MTSDVERWLEARLDDVPEELHSRLHTEDGPTRETVADELVRRGLDALSGAAARTGRHRESAFRLLVADAYLTFACEAILDGPDPPGAFEELVRRVAAEIE